MKVTFWDVLSILGLLVICGVGAFFLGIYNNPQSALNPYPPATLPPSIVIPSDTPTLPSLPDTWTPAVSITPTFLRASSTLPPTSTGFVLPTFTPSNTPTPTITETPLASLTPTRGPDQAVWVDQSPADGTTFSPGQEFDMVWTVRNTGSLTWTTAYYYAYSSGPATHEKSQYNLRASINPNETVDLIVDMFAPAQAGSYTVYWKLYNPSGTSFYTVNFTFTVR